MVARGTAPFIGVFNGADIYPVQNVVDDTYWVILGNKIIITGWEKTQLRLTIGLPNDIAFHTIKIRKSIFLLKS
tara:strand:- start:79 stop:300 length:222 start_codon:yes stop_codon:yes gene_type:complete